jgi:RNA polymerase sigma factor (sigma-70 family)
MESVGLRKVVERLRRGLSDRVPDGELLGRFVTSRDQAAFTELVERHGPKVYAVCRRVLGHHQLAEDAYQATLVVLAKKAHSIQPRSAVGGFLYGVANKAALKAFAMNHRRKELLVGTPPDSRSTERAAVDSDVLVMLDEEIANLSDILRAAVILCELDGLSRTDAARQLGIAEGTLSSRLAAARRQLAERLKRRGVVLSASLMAALAQSVTEAGPPILDVATESVSAIAKGVLQTMLLGKLKLTALAAVFAAALGMSLLTPNGREEAVGAPAPKARPDEGLIWTYHFTSGELTAYTPAGEKEKTLNLKDGRQLLGITPGGKKIAFVGISGKLVGPGAGPALNVHLRDINEETQGRDTGIQYYPGDQLRWSHDGKRVIRERPVAVSFSGAPDLPAFDHMLIDLETKKEETSKGVGLYQQVLGWSPDDKWLLLAQYSKANRVGNLTNYRTVLHRYDFETKTSKALGESLQLYNPVVSRNGRTLFGVGCKPDDATILPRCAMVRVDIANGKATEVFHHENQGLTSCAWSLDDKRVAYLWYDTTTKGKAHLVTCDLDGRNAKSVAIPTPKGDANELMILGWFPKEQKADPPKSNPEAEKLVPKLGSRNFAEREAAEKKLRELGATALAAVTAGLRSSDPEIARRCALIRPHLGRDMAWTMFRKIAGDTPQSKSLFTEMMADKDRAAAVLAVALDATTAARQFPAELARQKAARDRRMREAMVTWNLPSRDAKVDWAPVRGDWAAILFLGSFPETVAAPKAEIEPFESVPFPPGELIPPPMRKLFHAWGINRRHPESISYALDGALLYEIQDYLPFARKLAADPKAPVRIRGDALLIIGQFGDQTDLPLLTRYLSDASVYKKPMGDSDAIAQIRDVAATMMLKLCGRRPDEFGFLYGLCNPDAYVNHKYYMIARGFTDGAARDSAHAKAKAWRDKQLKSESKKDTP